FATGMRAPTVSVELGPENLPGSLCPAKLRRRGAEAAAEAAVEVRQVVEAATIGDVDDLAMAIGRAFQHGPRLLQAQCGDAGGEWHGGFLQKVLKVARRYAEPGCDRRGRELRIGEMLPDFLDDGVEARGAHTAAPGDFPRIPRGTERQCHEIVHMRREKAL